MKNLFFLIILFSTCSLFASSSLTVVAVGDANSQAEKMAFVLRPAVSSNLTKADQTLVGEFMQLLRNDFGFYKKYFKVIKVSSDSSVIAMKEKGFSYITYITFTKSSVLSFKAESFDVVKNTIINSKVGIITKSKLREVGHSYADELFYKIKKQASIFKSKIIFVTDRHSTKSTVVKELYMIDFDGKNSRRLTYHNGMVISPGLSFDKNYVLYSLISNSKKARNVNLRILNLKTNKSRVLSSRKGINSGAVFLPGDKEIALTLSHSGNAEIYIMTLANKKIRRLTKHFAPDVDPSINILGDKMAFLSGRPGKAMIYTSSTSGVETGVKRISYVGDFNATPRFSPDGTEIVFSSWLDNRFDIFRIDANGRNLSRLTKDFGSNEDPSYSNDGQFIVFSSQRVLSKRSAIQNLYIMDREGDILGMITNKFGNCITPRWSK